MTKWEELDISSAGEETECQEYLKVIISKADNLVCTVCIDCEHVCDSKVLMHNCKPYSYTVHLK